MDQPPNFDFVAFLDKHLVLISMIIGIALAIIIRRHTKPKTKEEDAGDDEGASLQELLKKSDDPASFSGETDDYRWTQTSDEIELVIPAATELARRDIKCSFRPNKIHFSIGERVVLDGPPFDAVEPEDCTWQIERSVEETSVVVTLRKKKSTTSTRHWRYVIAGHTNIGKNKVGPEVVHMDSSDPESIKRAVQRATNQ